MKIIDVEQGTREWFQAKIGIPSASNFDMIITPGGVPSKSAGKYMDELLAEWLAGEPIDPETKTYWMGRGNELEPEARAQYEFLNDADVQQVGFCLHDSGHYGCSPDGLIGEDGMLEIKNPKHTTMIAYYRNKETLINDYKPQVQGQLAVAGREYCDLVAYHPLLPHVQIRIEPDINYISLLTELLERFHVGLEAEKMMFSDLKAR